MPPTRQNTTKQRCGQITGTGDQASYDERVERRIKYLIDEKRHGKGLDELYFHEDLHVGTEADPALQPD